MSTTVKYIKITVLKSYEYLVGTSYLIRSENAN